MNLPITVTVFSTIVDIAAEIFKKKLEKDYLDILKRRKDRLQKVEKVQFLNNSYWEEDLDISGSTFWSIGNSEGLNICFDIFGVNYLYFYKTIKDKFIESGSSVAEIRMSALIEIFKGLGFEVKEDTFSSYFIPYVKAMPISSVDQLQQIRMIRTALRKSEDKIARNDEIVKWNLQTLTEKFKLHLSGTKWYLYFYGYGIDGSIIDDKTNWQIARLVLEFDMAVGKDLNVSIENTENPDHHNYSGKTDFSQSTEKVLVLNLRTYKKNFPPTRQLNIKLFVNGAEGSLFFGQYLNYEVNSGRILSGDLIIEQVKQVEENKAPFSFVFKGSKSELVEGISEHLKEIEHVIPFFRDSKAVFRETSTSLFTVRKTGSKQEVVPINATLTEKQDEI